METDKYTGRIVYEGEGRDWVDTSKKPKKVKDSQQTTRDQVRGMEQIIQKVKRKTKFHNYLFLFCLVHKSTYRAQKDK